MVRRSAGIALLWGSGLVVGCGSDEPSDSEVCRELTLELAAPDLSDPNGVFEATATDADGNPVRGLRLSFNLERPNPTPELLGQPTTNEDGVARIALAEVPESDLADAEAFLVVRRLDLTGANPSTRFCETRESVPIR